VKYFLLIFILLFSTGLFAEDLVHVVGRGDTIYSIARFYDVIPDELMRVNNISDPSKLQVGRRLTIPATAFSNINPVQSPVRASPAPVLIDYRVAKGDTLFGIARSHEITLAALLEMNNFSQNHVIRVGDVIKVPGRSSVSTAAARESQPTAPAVTPGILTLLWPVNAKGISYMTGQMGVVVEGEHFEPVKSLTQGRVISAGPWRKFGKVAIVEASGGYLYMYGGCESLSVKVGDRISAGTELGKLGVNAVSEKPQLFFMVFRSDTPIDPAKAPRAGSNSRT
jgi:murein DD-endopeptidase MepM/ murein hydrolase activator NlpD